MFVFPFGGIPGAVMITIDKTLDNIEEVKPITKTITEYSPV